MQAAGGWNFPQVGPVACLALALAGPLPPHQYQEKNEVGTRLEDQSLQTPGRQLVIQSPTCRKDGVEVRPTYTSAQRCVCVGEPWHPPLLLLL